MLDIYVDADACPVKEHTFKVAKRYAMKVYVVSRVPIFLPKADWIIPVVSGEGFDAVDNWIAENTQTDDIVITNDLLLAERCLKRGSRVVDPRGRVLDEDNIGEALATRELLSELRQRGEIGLGPQKMGKKNQSNFLSSLDTVIQKIKNSRR